MLHKHVESFCQQFQLDLNMLSIMLLQGHRNLIVVATNSPFVQKAVVNTAIKTRIPCVSNDVADLHSSYGSVGSYLHRLLDDSDSSQVDIGIFDYTNVVKTLPLSTLSEEINHNRDVFTKVFSSSIMIVPPGLLDSIMRHAIDFWSCVELCIYGASWIQNPRDLPIWYYEYSPDVQVIENIKQLPSTIRTTVLALRDKITKVDRFSKETVNSIVLELERIKAAAYMQYLDLFILAVYKISKSRVSHKERTAKHDFLTCISANTLDNYTNAVILEIVGDYLFDCKEYEEALEYYKHSVLLGDTIIGASGERLHSLVTTNMLICRYLTEKLTQDELFSRLSEADSEASFANSFYYLFKPLTKLLLCDDLYLNRKDMLSFFMDAFQKNPLTSVSIHWCGDLVYWEEFLLGNLSETYYKSKISRTKGDALRYAYKTVYAFCVGDVNSMKMHYKQFIRIARQYEWFSILEVMHAIMKNMQFILGYCEDKDKLMSTDNTE